MNSQNSGRLILVTGASGYVGGRLVTALLEDGASVRVFVRDQKKAQSNSWASSVEIATGNASDYQSTLKALYSFVYVVAPSQIL